MKTSITLFFTLAMFFTLFESGYSILSCCFNGKFGFKRVPKIIYRGTHLPDKYIPLEQPFEWIDSDDNAYHVAIIDIADNMIRPIMSGPKDPKRIKIYIKDPKRMRIMDEEDMANNPVNMPSYEHPSRLSPLPWKTRTWTRSGQSIDFRRSLGI
ncbi:uncharacterized protein LOC117175011 [Belonocnema kinseyi]|uniref:uncharacterized protein LOC117175011 n=1 Tax=Belonocnema kinseyi TaxID=2817044 RepID=UPI00143CD32F|nr:uncharacterized protein LOC117175011 [Belonocnema kinseyi]XP_033220399.1 uncharacterized protein LOC117175011 [Belonocnema kinseyi]XP_033220400.1 uncharacterized protein LOC117175011 [Belonocnema kinseyi]XP_033220401.1 uncharacterized protein LOC117175011 [Belonocnema kinseyi]